MTNLKKLHIIHPLLEYYVVCVWNNLAVSLTVVSHCYKEDATGRNADCPVCSKHMNELARPLPFAHCAQSRLICCLTGAPLNEHNPPMMLPNGNVYGYSVSNYMLYVPLLVLGSHVKEHNPPMMLPNGNVYGYSVSNYMLLCHC